jgi:hypothetical protein
MDFSSSHPHFTVKNPLYQHSHSHSWSPAKHTLKKLDLHGGGRVVASTLAA